MEVEDEEGPLTPDRHRTGRVRQRACVKGEGFVRVISVRVRVRVRVRVAHLDVWGVGSGL